MRSTARDGKGLWTFKTGSEIKSSPVVVNDIVLVGSYDAHLYGLDAKTGKLRWKVLTDGQVHATPAVQNGLAFIAGCDAKFRAIRVTDGRQMFVIDSGAYTGASPLLDGDRAYFGTFDNEVLALDLKARKIAWRYADPDTRFPYYSSAALSGGRVILGGRDKVDPRARRQDGQGSLALRHARARRLVAGRRRRSRLRRIQRRQPLRPRRRHREEDLRVQRRRRDHRLARHRRRQGRDRLAGRHRLRTRVTDQRHVGAGFSRTKHASITSTSAYDAHP